MYRLGLSVESLAGRYLAVPVTLTSLHSVWGAGRDWGWSQSSQVWAGARPEPWSPLSFRSNIYLFKPIFPAQRNGQTKTIKTKTFLKFHFNWIFPFSHFTRSLDQNQSIRRGPILGKRTFYLTFRLECQLHYIFSNERNGEWWRN